MTLDWVRKIHRRLVLLAIVAALLCAQVAFNSREPWLEKAFAIRVPPPLFFL